ncbi:MAG: sugar phosphate isomerase/epimerase [Deltaproteobacteria bacterium]|nr:sugar phosphate isomerase/epimerase [Deltaproteobacteria bacterium]
MIIIGARAHTLEEIDEVGRMGYPYAEISLDDPDEIEDQLPDLLRLQESYGIAYIAHYPNEGNPFDVDGLKIGFVPKIKRLIDMSARLDIHKATIHFWMDRRWAPPELVEQKIGLLKAMVAHAKDRDIVLCIENLSERFESFAPAFETIEDLRMTLDIGHGQLLSKVNTSIGFIENVFERIAHVHVHDNWGGTGVRDDLHLGLGQGIIDYPGILSLLCGKGYDATITMEVKPADMLQTSRLLQQYLYKS